MSRTKSKKQSAGRRPPIDLREEIFLIESPSDFDLYSGRNEGDALARTLALAEVNVTYYLATTEETFDRALDDIVIRVNNSQRDVEEWPFIHISAHGSEDGIELTDGTTLYWGQLTKRIQAVHDLVGCVTFPDDLPQDVPKINLTLSSCSAFSNYKETLSKPYPFQMMLGPTVDVGWCQSLIAFSTFFYRAFIKRDAYRDAVDIMNTVVGDVGSPTFQCLWSHDIDKILQEIDVLDAKKANS